MVASAFAPVMIIWFGTLGVLGLMHVSDDPTVMYAINPVHAVGFLLTHGVMGLVILGAVFLAVTGGEALYADLGHFGRKPIQAAWFFLRAALFAHQLLSARARWCCRIPQPSKIRSIAWCRKTFWCH